MSGSLKSRCCQVCFSKKNLAPCSGCHIVYYCGAAHQNQHREEHTDCCDLTNKARDFLDAADRTLRDKQGHGETPGDVFETAVGTFEQFPAGRDYLASRVDFTLALLHNFSGDEATHDGVKTALDMFLNVLQLSRTHVMANDMAAGLYLRLSRDQEAYDFLKWIATTGADPNYDWTDMAQPFLNIHGADALEPLEPNWLTVGDPRSMSFAATVILIKFRIICDLMRIQNISRALRGFLPPEIINIVRSHIVQGDIVLGCPRVISNSIENNARILSELKAQLWQLVNAIDGQNPIFLGVIANPQSAYQALGVGNLVGHAAGDPTAAIEAAHIAFTQASLNIDAWDETMHATTILGRMLRDRRRRLEILDIHPI